MRCEASTRRGRPCVRPARAGERLCASHARRRARRHNLYRRVLAPEERRRLGRARAAEGVAEEIAMTRLMIQRHARDGSPIDYARLADALKKLVLAEHRLAGGGDGLA